MQTALIKTRSIMKKVVIGATTLLNLLIGAEFALFNENFFDFALNFFGARVLEKAITYWPLALIALVVEISLIAGYIIKQMTFEKDYYPVQNKRPLDDGEGIRHPDPKQLRKPRP